MKTLALFIGGFAAGFAVSHLIKKAQAANGKPAFIQNGTPAVVADTTTKK